MTAGEDENLIAGQLQNELPIVEVEVSSFEDLKGKWASYFNNLIQNDFPKMVDLFYRIDISEDKLRRILKENPDENAGKMITSMVIDRLWQKIRSREAFPSKPDDFSGDPEVEKW